MKKIYVNEKNYFKKGIPHEHIVLKYLPYFKAYEYNNTNICIGGLSVEKVENYNAYSVTEVTNACTKIGEYFYNVLDCKFNKSDIKYALLIELSDSEFNNIQKKIIEFCHNIGFPYDIKIERQILYELIIGRDENKIYQYICGSISLVDFMYDTILLFLIAKIHKLLYTIGGYGNNESENKSSILKLNKYVNNLTNSNSELKIKDVWDKNVDSLKETIIKKLKPQLQQYEVTSSNIYYNKQEKECKMYRSSNSIMGIAYYGIMLYAMSDNCRMVRECKEESCINFVDMENAENKSPYCNWCNAIGIRHRKKSQTYYNKHKGQI